jgi:hypothetical protein
MSHPQPPQRQPTPDETQKYIKVLHNTAIVAAVVCPVLALLPPRKFDIYTFGLGGATLFSANYLTREQTGRSAWQHIADRGGQPVLQTPVDSGVIPSTEQANLHRELRYANKEMKRLHAEKALSVTEQVQSQRDLWKMEREKEIKEDIEEGKSFGDMITDQIWEVWNWGKKSEDDD